MLQALLASAAKVAPRGRLRTPGLVVCACIVGITIGFNGISLLIGLALATGLIGLAVMVGVLELSLFLTSVTAGLGIYFVTIQGSAPRLAYYAGDAALVLAIVCLMVERSVRNEPQLTLERLRPIRPLLCLAVFCGVAGGLIQGSSLSTSILGLRWLAYPYAALLVAESDRAQRLTRWATIGLGLGVLCQLPVAVYQVATKVLLPAPEFIGATPTIGYSVRAFGLLGWPTTLALYLQVPALFLAFRSIHIPRLREVAVMMPILGVFILTFSRGAFTNFIVGLAAGLIVYVRWTGSRSRATQRVVRGLVGLAVVLVASLGVGLSGLNSRTTDFQLSNYSAPVASGGRLAIARVGLRYWRTAPLVGVGPGRFGGGVSQARGSSLNVIEGRRILTAESALLQLLVEQGLIGVGALIALVWLFSTHIRRPARPDPATAVLAAAAFGSLVALFVSTLSAPSLELRQAAWPVWLIVAAALAKIRAARRLRDESAV